MGGKYGEMFGVCSLCDDDMMMMGYMYDENDNNYLPYMICMYVHVHEKRNELEYKVHYGMKMKVKIFKRHRTFLYLYPHV